MKYKVGDLVRLIGFGNWYCGTVVITRIFKVGSLTKFEYKMLNRKAEDYLMNGNLSVFDEGSLFYDCSKITSKDELMVEEL